MSKILRETVAERTMAALRRQILDRELSPGSSVTEDAVAREMGVSRTTSRQALNTLMVEGLLTRNPSTRILQVTTLNRDDIVEIYRARRFLENAGVDASAQAEPDELALLAVAVNDMERAVEVGDLSAFVQADYRCHAQTVAFLRSVYLSDTHALLMSKLRLTITQVEGTDERDSAAVLLRHQQYRDFILSRATQKAKANLAQRLDEAEKLVLANTHEKH